MFELIFWICVAAVAVRMIITLVRWMGKVVGYCIMALIAISLLQYAHVLNEVFCLLDIAAFAWLMSRIFGSTTSKRRRRESLNWTRIIMLVVPIFWPFLIVRFLCGGKILPTDMTPYDYEQHEKCNARQLLDNRGSDL